MILRPGRGGYFTQPRADSFAEPCTISESSRFNVFHTCVFHHNRPRKRAAEPLTPILPDAHDRIFTAGYSYYPVHTEIYGTYRPRSTR